MVSFVILTTSKPSQALPRQLPRRGSQAVTFVAEVSGSMRKFPAVLKPSPTGGRWRVAPDEGQHPLAPILPQSRCVKPDFVTCGDIFPRSGGRCRAATKGGVCHRAAMTERAHAVSPVAKVSNAIRNFTSTSKSSPLRGSWRAVRRD